MNNFVQRCLSILVLVPAILYVVYVGGWWLQAVICLALIIMLKEWRGIMKSSKRQLV